MRSFRVSSAESDVHEKEKFHSHLNPLRKRLVLGTIIDRLDGARDAFTRFFELSAAFSDAEPTGDTTTRKASAPS
jgi:hypothetical protein